MENINLHFSKKYSLNKYTLNYSKEKGGCDEPAGNTTLYNTNKHSDNNPIGEMNFLCVFFEWAHIWILF